MEKKPISVLFVGNSVTYCYDNIPKFKALCEAAGVPVVTEQCVYGGAALTQYRDPNDFRGVMFREAITKAAYDYVVLQDASGETQKTSCEAVEDLMPFIRENGAVPLFYMRFPDVTEPQEQVDEQNARFFKTYTELAAKYHTVCAPVLTGFLRGQAEHPEIDFYAQDRSHQNPIYGSYLIACTWAYAFLGVDPVGNPYIADVPVKEAEIIQKIAKRSVDEPLSLT